MKVLQHKIELLTARDADVRTELLSEKMRRGMDPTAEVTLWLDNVEKIKAKVARLEAEIQERKSFLCGCFPNYYYRLKLGNNISEKMREADKLLDQRDFPGSSLVNTPPEKGKVLPTGTLVGETARRILQRIQKYLIDPNTGIIGIYGMGGVGKTTIVKEINNKLVSDDTHFDDVIWTTASKDSNLEKLQKDIAKAIGLNFDDDDDEDSELTRAFALFQALLRRGRFLLIIDDLWEAFSLENIGIPVPTNVNGCKLLITTRSLSVCRSMETSVDVKVHVLSEEDAWALFKQKVGEELVQSSLRIQDVAKKVAAECGGVPLALITIGRALRKENDIKHWKAALSELRNSTANIEGLDNLVFARLRFSYGRLKDDTTRSCFLYCALYPEDHHIETEELIKYWLWEGLLGTRANSSFMVKAGHGLRVQPVENEWFPNLERVSLMRNDLSFLSLESEYPSLCTLLLQYNSISKGIHPTFFNHMRNLKVLDLSYTGINNLPDSFSDLENLHVLLLCSCWNLQYVPTLSKLKELRVLDLSYTSSLEHLPQGMDMMFYLQYLNLSYTNASEFPVHLLPNYKFLESLFLIGPWQFTLGQTFIDALSRCTSLAVLEVNFSSMQDFDRYLMSDHWRLLKNFKFFIGYPPSSTRTGKNSIGIFGVDIYEAFYPIWLQGWILELEIHDCCSITGLPAFVHVAAAELQCCKIRSCDRMEFIISAEQSTLPNLERLEIEGLSKLYRICYNIVPTGTLASLKVLHVTGCDKLRTLLPYELAKNLKNLVEISIENCKIITEVIGEEEVEGDVVEQTDLPSVVFPMLQKMKLSGLPELKHLYNGIMVCDNLSSVEVYGCPELKTLSFLVDVRKQMLRSLKQIKGSKKWWRELMRRSHIDAIPLLNPIFKQLPPEDPSVPEPSSVQEDSGGGSGSSSFGPR